MFPDTDAISPRTRAWPAAGGVVVGAVADGDAELVVLAEVAGLDVFDEPHATTDAAVTPVTASKANRASRDG
ncbi:hypothetical protein [Mycobacterium sp. 050128]|uniref:hypothetical protein n=1 Tax=Mycobacterium sp. 050128 TaxID=3096112 RepID=UPI003FA594AC